jgi:sulfite exporter TauE/SafE
MTPVFFPLAVSMFALGAVHAFGPDHLAAMTVLAGSAPTSGRVARISLQFALGHASLLLFAAIIAFGLGSVPSAASMRVAEIVGGLTLIAVGAATVHRSLLHVREHGMAPRAGWVGSLLAASGTRSLVMAVPAAATGNVVEASLLTVAFGLGVVAGMLGFGLMLGYGHQRLGASPRWRQSASLGSGILAVCVGLYWTFAQLATN